MSSPHFLRLRCTPHSRPYGKPAPSSLAALVAGATPENAFTPAPSTRFGEIWLGDHPSSPAYILPSNTPLLDLLASNPSDFLTPALLSRFPSSPAHRCLKTQLRPGRSRNDAVGLPR